VEVELDGKEDLLQWGEFGATAKKSIEGSFRMRSLEKQEGDCFGEGVYRGNAQFQQLATAGEKETTSRKTPADPVGGRQKTWGKTEGFFYRGGKPNNRRGTHCG